MRKSRRVRMRTGLKAFTLIVVVASLAFAGIWAWQRAHRLPTSHYREPGWMPAHRSDRWTCIVIHHSASEVGGAERIDRWHRDKKWDGLGYDFVIGNGTDTPVGTVEVGFRWAEQREGATARPMTSITISMASASVSSATSWTTRPIPGRCKV